MLIAGSPPELHSVSAQRMVVQIYAAVKSMRMRPKGGETMAVKTNTAA